METRAGYATIDVLCELTKTQIQEAQRKGEYPLDLFKRYTRLYEVLHRDKLPDYVRETYK